MKKESLDDVINDLRSRRDCLSLAHELPIHFQPPSTSPARYDLNYENWHGGWPALSRFPRKFIRAPS